MAGTRNALVAERRSDPLRFAQCRSLGHEWRHKGTVDGGASQWGMIGLRSQCSDCKTERTKWVTRSGEVRTRYEYPDGYSRHGDERMSPQQWRQSFVVTLFGEERPAGGAKLRTVTAS